MGCFTQEDPRAEYWLYSEDGLKVSIGRGGISGACHFNTSDIYPEAGGPLGTSKAADILAQFMCMWGTDGYKTLVLHRDGKYELTEDQVAVIDHALSRIGFHTTNGPNCMEIVWTKRM
jgi:hypothetical protein